MSQEDPNIRVRPSSASEAETEQLPKIDTNDVSDVVLAESATGAAPSFPAPSPPIPPTPETTHKRDSPPEPAPHGKAPLAMLPGARVDDFEIVRMLGRGAFGHVYLARQLSLDRLVALKVSANRGSEGRTMARLEHQHIVQVFSEKVEPDFNQRLLCMQLVPGVGLEKLIGVLHATHAGSRSPHPPEWTGAELLAIIDRSASLPAELDPSALHDREAIARMDAVEVTAWFGARLAEALDFAHSHGVLHRDIKPANILVNPYGRPLLADFNISSQPVGTESSGDEMFGGTFAYMSPEHLDAFNPADPTEPEAVTSRSDIYSLGLVLQQLLEGQVNIATAERKGKMAEMLRTMADSRRAARPTCRAGLPSARMTLERAIARCIEPDPNIRFASGAELAEQLDGCRRLRQAEKQLPPPPALLRAVARRPFLWLVVLVLIPQLVGSAVNIKYNELQIIGKLSQAQDRLFDNLVIGYNVIVYPFAIAILLSLVIPVWRCWRALARAEILPIGDVETARQNVLRLPRWTAILVGIGWFPGAILFPLLIGIFTTSLTPSVWAHFIASFCLSGLIALAYSLCGVEYVVLQVLYPGMWQNTRSFGETTQRELAPVATQLRWIQRLAVAIPLLAAMAALSIVIFSDKDQNEVREPFYYLLFGLNALGLLGSIVAGSVTRELSKVIVALTSTKA